MANFLEPLESRVLLSVAHLPVAKPEFVIFHPIGLMSPSDTASPTGYSPATLRQAYGINSTNFGSVVGDGTGQTIAIVDAYDAPTIAADLHAFDVAFGLSDPPSLVKIGQTGTTRLPGADTTERGNSWAIETSLDVEWAHAIAPKAKIVLVEANSASDADLFAAINTARNYAGVSVVSMSWGGDEFSGESAYDSYFTTPSGHTGVTFIASSGDSGAYSPNTRTVTVEYPAVSPNVLAVGGTSLTVNGSGNYVSEIGWGNGTRSGTSGGSGGGLSRYYSQPSYQSGVVTQSTTKRAVPDVSFLADPNTGVSVYDSWDFGASAPWAQVGGTSLAAPMWAGVIAIADQGRVLSGGTTLDGATQTLPDIYALPSSDFHDITSGNNGYAAGAGYDLVTGRGTPIVNLLVQGLSGTATTPPAQGTPVVGSFTINPASVLAGTSVTLSAGNVQETGGTIGSVAFYLEANSSIGVQSGVDTLLGSGAQNGSTWTLTMPTTGMSPGNYVCYAIATDNSSVSSSPVAAALTIQTPAAGAPANDLFASATPLTGTAATVTGTNVGATKEPGEPNNAGNAGGKSVWYNWTAPSSGMVTLTTRGSSFDTTLGVYTGNSVSSLTTIAGNDDTSYYALYSTLSFNAVKGQTYRISVDGYRDRTGNVASGNIVLALSEAVAPANDMFASAAQLLGNSLTWTGTNVNATAEVGEPRLRGLPGGSSIWFTWTAPTTRTVSLNTNGSNFDTTLAVYTGSSLSNLVPIAANDDVDTRSGILTSALTFNAVAGTTYCFCLDGYNGAQGNVVLNLA